MKKNKSILYNYSLAFILFYTLSACSSHRRELIVGGVVGAAVGAGVGHVFVHHGREKEYQDRNTIITAAVFGVLTASLLAFHFNALNEQELKISGRFSRYKLCPEGDMLTDGGLSSSILSQDFTLSGKKGSQILSIDLDETTKWIAPDFRKRLLPAQQSDKKAVASHYLWEIARPGFFVTKDKSPHYFLELKDQSQEGDEE